MKLRDVLIEQTELDPRLADVGIVGITADSRRVKPGDLFFAVPGAKADGLAFVPQAVGAGAVAVAAEAWPSAPLPEAVAFVKVRSIRRALALAAAQIHPRQPPMIAAVTGTSGKTSIVTFTRQIWSALGHAAASVGTIGVVAPGRETYGSLTTPDPIDLHRSLDALAGEGVTHLAIEASSHGLDQHRLDGVRITAAAFTNLTRDHLDYHPSFDDYLQAKLRLFTELLPQSGTAVVEVDHDHAQAFLDVAHRRGVRVLTVGRAALDLRLVETTIEGFAQRLRLAYLGRETSLLLPLVGAFQIENALVAAGLAIATGGEPDRVFAALEHLKGAKGRLELVGQSGGAPIFVDYAHKPDALAKALEALRPYAKRRLIVVFGAGGDRDVGKRPIMGAIAVQKADRVIVTDDNPRSEDPAAIRAAILLAAPGAAEIGDRREAIRAAIGELQPGDALLIAGKGHESGQIIGNRVLPFTDHEAVAAVLKETVA